MNSDAQQPPPEMVTANVAIKGTDWQLQTKISVPKGPVQPKTLLPLAQSFAEAVVNSAVKLTEEAGRKISCKKGCGACCRQLVPIARTEARHIREVVDNLPEPRRTEIRARFAAARRKLEEAGLLEELLHRDGWTNETGRSTGLKYFHLGIPCPFLEEESCSIYADRPIACREYLVTSPAENCAQPTPETVQTVKLPLKVWIGVARFDKEALSERHVHWVPLILAPEWAETHPDEPSARPGPELLQELMKNIVATERPLTESESASEQD